MEQLFTHNQYNRMNKFCTKIEIDYEKNIRIPQTVTYLMLLSENKITMPQNITYLHIDSYYINNYKLPINIEYFDMENSNITRNIILPYSVTHLIVSKNIFKLKLHSNVTHLKFSQNFNEFIIIPYHITHLIFGDYFNQKIIIPKNVIHLTFGKWFKQPITIPPNITHLTFKLKYVIHIKVPSTVTQLVLPCNMYKNNKITKIKTHKNTKIIYS